jgi:hypothetical protein
VVSKLRSFLHADLDIRTMQASDETIGRAVIQAMAVMSPSSK